MPPTFIQWRRLPIHRTLSRRAGSAAFREGRRASALVGASRKLRESPLANLYLAGYHEVAGIAEMSLPDFSVDFSVPSLKANMDLAVGQRLVKPFELDTMIWKP